MSLPKPAKPKTALPVKIQKALEMFKMLPQEKRMKLLEGWKAKIAKPVKVDNL